MPMLQILLFFLSVLKCYLLEDLPSGSTALQAIPLNTSSLTEGLPDLKSPNNRYFFQNMISKFSHITKN